MWCSIYKLHVKVMTDLTFHISPCAWSLLAMPSRSSSTGKAMKTVHATAKATSAKWAALALAKAKAKATSAVQKSSGQKRPRSASDSSEDEVVATFAKKKRAVPEIDEVVTEPEMVDAEEERESVVDLEKGGSEHEEEEEVSLSFQLDVDMTLTSHSMLVLLNYLF